MTKAGIDAEKFDTYIESLKPNGYDNHLVLRTFNSPKLLERYINDPEDCKRLHQIATEELVELPEANTPVGPFLAKLLSLEAPLADVRHPTAV
jgi:hypothetical protein